MKYKVITGIMLTMLLMGMLGMAVHVVPVFTVGAEHPAQAIWVEPDYFDTLQKYEEFTVSVMVNITDPPGLATGMYGWEYYLHWNATWLRLVSHAEPSLPADFGWVNAYWVKKNISPAPGYFANESVWCSATAMSPDPSFTGVMWLSNYTFRVEKNVYEPEPTYVGHIRMDLIGLIDDMHANIITPFTDKKVVEFRICPHVGGDVNSDGIVDIKDIVTCALAFGSKLGDPNWNPYADLKPDGIIDIFDLVTIAINYGKRL